MGKKSSRAEVSICSIIVPLCFKKKRKLLKNHHCFDLKRNNNTNIHYHIKHRRNSKLPELIQSLQSAISQTAGQPQESKNSSDQITLAINMVIDQ